jgi:signal transduction histidine kinase
MSTQTFASRVQLQQILMNLMLNAIEAMKDTGGEMTIKAKIDSNGLVVTSVSDTGVGLAAENIERIFDPFHTTKPQGTGSLWRCSRGSGSLSSADRGNILRHGDRPR